MKYFITIFLLSFALSGFTQSFKIIQDTIFNYGTPVGLIVKSGKNKVAYFESSSSMDLSRDWISSLRSVSKSEVHGFLFKELLVFDVLTNKVLKNGLHVGDFEKKEREYIGDNNLLVTIYSTEISREFVIYSWRAINPKTRVPKIEYNFDEERERRKQRNLRIERFFC